MELINRLINYRGVARPAQADSAATQVRILDAATRLFAEHGDTSIRAIAAASGVTLATVHHYFGSKEQLYDACVRAMYTELEELRTEVTQAFVQIEGVDDLIEQTVRTSFRFAWDHRGAIRLLMRTIIDAGHMDPIHRSQVHLPFLDQASKLLGRAFDRKRNEMRLTVQSMMHLVVRYALTDASELALIAGTQNEERAIAAIEDHLVAVSLSLLGRK
jgi:AcrR family transcriptional regulator